MTGHQVIEERDLPTRPCSILSNNHEISRNYSFFPKTILKSAYPYPYYSKQSKTKHFDKSNVPNVYCKHARGRKILPRRKHRSSRVHHIKRPFLDFEKMQKVSKNNKLYVMDPPFLL